MNFAEILQRFMDRRGLNQYSLSKASKIPQSSINRWINSAYMPTLDKLNEMCQNMGITLADFFAEASGATLVKPNDEKVDGFIAALTQSGQPLSAEIVNAFSEAADKQSAKRQKLHAALDQLLDEYEAQKHD